jgi:8-oxo-dGTP pyrophosphatase MutT (NUDIX family)
MNEPVIIGRRNLTDAAIIIPLIDINGECHVLFEKRAAHISQGSEICFPGGEFDPALDATLQDTAMRETCEELGIHKEHLSIKCRLGTIIALRGIAVDCFIAMLSDGAIEKVSIDRSEVERIFLVPVSHFERHAPETYSVHVEMHPSIQDENGEMHTLLPVDQLGLPEKYRRPWCGKKRKVIVYQITEGPVWGLTADIIAEMLYRMTK